LASAYLDELVGFVEIMQAGEALTEPAKIGDVLYEGGTVKTAVDGKVRLTFNDGTLLRLGPNSEFVFQGIEEEDGESVTKIELLFGNLFVILSGGSLDVDTPSGVASVRGSYMEVRIDPDTGVILITCLEGDCSAQTNGGTESVVAGQTLTLTSEDLPPEVGSMSPEDIANWLNNNPEATVVVVPLTATVAALITPSATSESSPTATTTPVVPTNTTAPPAAEIIKDNACKSGPYGSSSTVGTVFTGQTVNVVGQSDGWWVIEFPGSPGVLCWVPMGSATGNTAASGVASVPNPPEPSATPKPTKEVRDDPTAVPSATPDYCYPGYPEYEECDYTIPEDLIICSYGQPVLYQGEGWGCDGEYSYCYPYGYTVEYSYCNYGQ
jgi:hypothetical protein